MIDCVPTILCCRDQKGWWGDLALDSGENCPEGGLREGRRKGQESVLEIPQMVQRQSDPCC